MKRAVAYLLPFMDQEKQETIAAGGSARAQGKVLLATVKGDVHDIGKNIVGVVLGCNNYQIIDLGVMVPCEKILETAANENVDMIGLSGLITPSLDEMVHVAREMERRGMKLPLLIGGATTSRQHTAVKIAPEYHAPTVHVLDASRAVGVVSRLRDPEQRVALDGENRADQQRLRELHQAKRERPLLPLSAARDNRERIEWRREDLPTPEFLGRRELREHPLEALVGYIDWSFFFAAWELPGRFPAVLDDPTRGPAARELYADAQKLLGRIVRERLLTASAAYGFWPAGSDGDDIVVYPDARRDRELCRFPMLRQQQVKTDTGARGGAGPGAGPGAGGKDRPHVSLADFVAPLSSGVPDHVGAFAVTAGLGADELARRFQADLDDHSAILVKALADRLAEAFAESLHQRARREWGYGAGESFSHEDLIAEKYRGIRPAFGYPACPDHTEKQTLFRLLQPEAVGIRLTESFAMIPAASVSGLYLAHPRARYFNLGKIDRDQVEDYARRKGMTVAEVERWLAPNLGYDPRPLRSA
jgi:5-methyltetrahydrofolate--homocysteine methyltransferase